MFNRALPVLAALLKYAEALRLRRKGSNPCRGMPRYWREPKERYLTPAEYRRIGAALREQEVAYPAQVALMRLLLFIGRGYTGGNNLDLGTALEADDKFGQSVSLNAAGDRLAVGAWLDDGIGKVLCRAQAMDVARRVLLRAQTGDNPAEERKRLRKVPSYRDFLRTYWERVSPKWKPSTLYTHRYYKQKYLDRAFEGLFLDEIEERHVQEWFNRITNTGGPGAANRCGEILRAMFNKAEQWGVRPEGSNPCLYIRKNKGRKCERFLSDQEFGRIGEVLRWLPAVSPLREPWRD